MRRQTLGESAGVRAGFHEGFHQVRKVVLRDAGSKTDTRDTGTGEQISEASFRGRGFQRHTVEQQLSAGGAQQQATLSGSFDRVLEFSPCRGELPGATGML